MVTTAPARTPASGPGTARTEPSDVFSPLLRGGLVAAFAAGIALVALVLPVWPAGEDMGSTHYMGLLAANQPWNLLLFMAVPVVAAETIAVTELVILFTRRGGAGASRAVHAVNRWAATFVGFYFFGVTVYLLKNAVVPLTTGAAWRGAADLVAVGFYLLGLVPLGGLALLETRVLGATWDDERRLKMHATFVGVFLVVAHVAMIAGMLDPAVLGWSPTHTMGDGTVMPGMQH